MHSWYGKLESLWEGGVYMPRYKEAGGGRRDEDAPCNCKECTCDTVSECVLPFNDECSCKIGRAHV